MMLDMALNITQIVLDVVIIVFLVRMIRQDKE